MEIVIPITFYYWMLGLVCGVSCSIIYCNIKKRHEKIAGVIAVDNQSNLCKFHIESNDLSDSRTKKVTFNVVHGVDLSREEQSL